MNKKVENIADAIVAAVQKISRVENIRVHIEFARARPGAYA
ncbi:hypothetical protein [Caballeronia sp. 15715]